MKYRICLTAVAAAVVLGSVWLRDSTSYSFQLQGVSDARYENETIYLIDNNGDMCNLFMSDLQGRVKARIDVPKLQDNWWSSYSSITLDEDGQVYVYCYSRAMDSNDKHSSVYRCDFENGVLEQAWKLPDKQLNGRLIQIQVMDGSLYFVGKDEKGNCGFMRMDSQGQSFMCQELTEDAASVKDAYYHPEYGSMWADWNSRFYLGRTEICHEDTRDYADIRVEESGIFYFDVPSLTFRSIPFRREQGQALVPVDLVQAGNMVFARAGLDYMDILPFHYNEDGGFVGGVDISPGTRILGIFDSSGTQVGELSEMRLTPEKRFNMWIRTACACLAAEAVLSGLILLWYRQSKGKIPVLVKLLGVLVPMILLLSWALGRQLEQFLRERMMRRNYDLLYTIADLKLSDINPHELMRINLSDIPEDKYYRDIFKRKDYSVFPRQVYDYHEGVIYPVISKAYFWLFLEKEGDLRYAEVDGHHYYGARVMYDRGRTELDKMRTAMEREMIVETSYNDFSGDFIAVYVPVVDENRNSMGVLECGISSRILVYEVEQQIKQIHGMLGGIMALLLAALVSVLAFSLYPLKRVRAAVEEVSRGKLGVHLKIRGHDEVASIGQAFNHMSAKLKEQIDYIQACSAGYAAFVPQRVFEILDREDITKISLGDQKEIQAAVLSVGSRQFEEQARALGGDQLYGMINQVLREMIPMVAKENGVVDHMREDGIDAYYPNDCLGALRSAVSIAECLRVMRAEGSRIPVYHVCVSFGLVRVGIVGGKERMEASTISELMALSDFLKTMAGQVGAKILVLESAARQIPDFGKQYHVREIGTLYRKREGVPERVYDVYDGDEAGAFKAKEKTRDLFKKAMEAYRSRDFYDARLAFAGVLKENGKDLAARIYVYRCDQYYQTGDEKAVPPYLETY